ncbi:MAG TPA: GIY-YIG nuclease family protein [Beijerinckiaceae bacterium]|nr:GIY-YIG nuclease family protein [Beijerinckiaceae bacterium]
MSNDQTGTGRTIQLFLVDGVPNGLIIASIHGWTGSILVSTQSTFAKLLARPEADRTGIYVLFGPDPDDPLSMRAYIGEGDSVRERVGQSAKTRAFWETVAVVTTSDEALTKGHVRYLEARLIEMAVMAGRVTLDNGNAPSADRKRLPEADRANMEAFLENLKVVLPVVGFEFLKPKATRTLATDSSLGDDRSQFEIRHKSGIKAFALEIDGEFIVRKGSEALKDAGYKHNSSYGELRKELIEQGKMVPDPAGKRYVFVEDFPFRSPSAAAAVVLDRNSNGRTEWKVVGEKNLTYDDWQIARSNSPL